MGFAHDERAAYLGMGVSPRDVVVRRRNGHEEALLSVDGLLHLING